MVSIDRIGRRWLDTMGNIHDLQRRGVRIRSLADNEQSWSQYLDADPDSPESFLGYTRPASPSACPTRAGVHSPPYQGGFGEGNGGRQETGRPSPVVRGAGGRGHWDGRQRGAARSFGVSPATVRRAVKRE